MTKSLRAPICTIAIATLLAGGCSAPPKATTFALRCNVDICIVRFPATSFETFSRVWAYADERRLGQGDAAAWKEKGLRIGKVSAPFKRRVADLLWECGAEVSVFPHVEHISGTVISVEAGGRRSVTATTADAPAATETVIFQLRPTRSKRRGIDFDVMPAIAPAGGRGAIAPLESLAARICLASDEAIIIGPAAETGKLASYLKSPTREGWLQAFWVRVPADQPALD